MSTNSTTSNYISKIDQQFPVAGQNNDSSGFRNNFKNIKSALTYADQDINNLKLNSVKLIGTNDFNNSIIKRVVSQNSSVMVYDDTGNTQTGDVQLDYTNGSYQKIRLGGGTHVITVANWPTGAKSGSVVLSVITNSVAGSYVNFNAVNFTALGPEPLPLMLKDNVEQFFELWCDGDINNLFVRSLGGGNMPSVAELIAAAAISISTATTLTINTNVFSTSKNADTQYATTVTANRRAGNLALVPSQIKVRILNVALLDKVTDTTATTFPVSTTEGIMLGAFINFAGSVNPATFTVTNFSTSTITVGPAFEVGAFIPGDYVTVTNPRFTEQPTILTVRPTAASTTTSIANDLKGQVYANATSLFVTYDDHSYGSTNKVKISSDSVTMVTQPVTTKSTALATTEFVHNIMPFGAIIMWYGLISTIPTGWTLCNGANNTPDLTGKFVIGASIEVRSAGSSTAFFAATDITGGFTQSGGSKDSIVVTHDHTAIAAVSDPGHAHVYNTSGGRAPQSGSSTQCWTGDSAAQTATTTTGITVDIGIDPNGLPGTNANLPPYYALCYIMKIAGE